MSDFKFSDKRVPCKDCKDQHIGCHGSCEAYQRYSQKCKEKNEALATFYDYRKNAVGRYTKWLKGKANGSS